MLNRMKTVSVKIPELVFEEIAKAAKVRNVPKSEIIRERLTRINIGNPSLWSRMEDLVIQDDSLPTDLSSNQAHLSGYGKNGHHRQWHHRCRTAQA